MTSYVGDNYELPLLMHILDYIVPIREVFNVTKIAMLSVRSHVILLTAKHWFLLSCVLFITCFGIIFGLFYIQSNYEYSILRHIKLKHHWILYETSSHPRYCTYCCGMIRRQFLWMKRYGGWECCICKRISHTHCLMASDSSFCKETSTLDKKYLTIDNLTSNNDDDLTAEEEDNSGGNKSNLIEDDKESLDLLHTLIPGNLQSGALCSVCRTVCFSPFGLFGKRCIWCNRTFHDDCVILCGIDEHVCDLGRLKSIILAPNSFHIEMRRFPKIHSQSSNPKSKLDTRNRNTPKTCVSSPKDEVKGLKVKIKDYTSDRNLSKHTQRRRISDLIQIFPQFNIYERKMILNDKFFHKQIGKPLLVFVNTKSGGHVGIQLIRDLYLYLNPLQIVDLLQSKGPDEALNMFKPLAQLNRLLILVCGGDGTVRWVLDRCRVIYGSEVNMLPPVATLPLGTGNDLSRILGWGVSFDGNILQVLKKICIATVKNLDVWTCSAWDIVKSDNEVDAFKCTEYKTDPNETENNILDITNSRLLYSSTFFNYLDIGIAARIALKFHNLREKYPQHFRSRLGNQLVYGEVGLRDFLADKNIQLNGIKIWCDGNPVCIVDEINSTYTNSNDLSQFNSSKSLSPMCFNTQNLSNLKYFGFFSEKWTIMKTIFLILEPFCTFKLIKNTFSKILGYKVPLIINENSMSNNNEQLGYSCSPKDFKLEGLIICNIPSFAGGIKLWKLPKEYGMLKDYQEAKIKKPLRRTVTSIGNKLNKTIYDRSLSLSIEKLSSFVDLDDSDDPMQDKSFSSSSDPETFPNERYATMDTFKRWFSSVFKSNSNINTYRISKSFEYNNYPFPLSVSSSSQDNSTDQKSSFKHQKIDDGLIEVCGVRSILHLTQLQVGLAEPIKLCQGKQIVVEIPRPVPFQVDGEPRIIEKCRLVVEYSGLTPVLCPENSEKAITLPVRNALDLAVDKQVITDEQKRWITRQIVRENKILIS
ncbi:diacylglycerol kinase catalytic domain-containing family protein [Cryptosporidium serpentis]